MPSQDQASTGEKPVLFVCHGDDGGPRMHPCRRVQETLRAAGIEYEKTIAGHGSPLPFLRKGSREAVREATGDVKLPQCSSQMGRLCITPRQSCPGHAIKHQAELTTCWATEPGTRPQREGRLNVPSRTLTFPRQS